MRVLGAARRSSAASATRRGRRSCSALVKYHLGELEEAERLGLQARELARANRRDVLPAPEPAHARPLRRCARSRPRARRGAAAGGAPARGRDRRLARRRDLPVPRRRPASRQDRARRGARRSPRSRSSNVPAGGRLRARAACLLIEATIDDRRGPSADAPSSAFDEALRLLEEQRLPLDLGEARLAYGRALRRLGDDAGAPGGARARARATSTAWARAGSSGDRPRARRRSRGGRAGRPPRVISWSSCRLSVLAGRRAVDGVAGVRRRRAAEAAVAAGPCTSKPAPPSVSIDVWPMCRTSAEHEFVPVPAPFW